MNETKSIMLHGAKLWADGHAKVAEGKKRGYAPRYCSELAMMSIAVVSVRNMIQGR